MTEEELLWMQAAEKLSEKYVAIVQNNIFYLSRVSLNKVMANNIYILIKEATLAERSKWEALIHG
jgi:hypothetical protein